MRDYIDFIVDPFDADNIPEWYRIQTAYYGGDNDTVTVPATPNFPHSTPARYYIELPYIPDQSDFTARPMLLRDVTLGVNLTRVSGTPNANEYSLAPTSSDRPYIIQLNSAQAGNSIAYDYYSARTVITASEANGRGNCATVTVAAANSYYRRSRVAQYHCTGTDDDVIINAALTAVAAAGGGKVQLLDGTYNTTATINVPDNITLIGCGMYDGTIIKPTGGGFTYAIANSNGYGAVRDLMLDGSAASNQIGILGYNLNNIYSVYFGTGMVGARLTNCHASGTDEAISLAQYVTNCLVDVAASAIGYDRCKYITTSRAIGGSSSLQKYFACERVSNCEAYGGGGAGADDTGFDSCKHITANYAQNCNAGYKGCTNGTQNTGTGNVTFQSSCVAGETGSNAWANTANGGYNSGT